MIIANAFALLTRNSMMKHAKLKRSDITSKMQEKTKHPSIMGKSYDQLVPSHASFRTKHRWL